MGGAGADVRVTARFRPGVPAQTAGHRAPGERFTFPEHAATLEKIAATKGEAFYRGELAEKMETHARANGGAMLTSDLAAHRADWVDTIADDYRGYTVHEIPPNGQGIVALIALGILAELRHGRAAGRFGRQRAPADRGGEAGICRRAGLRRRRRSHAGRSEQLLDKEYLKERATLIDRARAKASAGTPTGGTVYLTAADADGMMVSMIQSNYLGFGSGVVVPGTGISLQNRGTDFVVTPGHPNQVGPQKRPYHTIIPGFCHEGRRAGDELRSHGRHHAATGPCAGRGADRRLPPEPAGSLRRATLPLGRGVQVGVENGFPPATLEELRRAGTRARHGPRLQPVRQLPGDLATRGRLSCGE